MRRAIQRLIQDPLALKLITGDFAEGDTILVDAAAEPDNELTFTKLVPAPVRPTPPRYMYEDRAGRQPADRFNRSRRTLLPNLRSE